MTKQEREPKPAPLTPEAVVSMAVETALRDGGHQPTKIADTSADATELRNK